MGRNYAISYDIRIYANLPERYLSNAPGRFFSQGPANRANF